MIRKFQHRQSKVIVTNDGMFKGYYKVADSPKFDTVLAEFVENTTDWVEIFEPKYQILSFQHPENKNIYKLNSDGTYGYERNLSAYQIYMMSVGGKKDLRIPIEKCLELYPIHSVKRLSDNVVFKLDSYFSHILRQISNAEWQNKRANNATDLHGNSTNQIKGFRIIGNKSQTYTCRNGKLELSFDIGDILVVDTIGSHFPLVDIMPAEKPIPPLTATVIITYSDKRPKQTKTLQQGDRLLIQF